MATLGWSGPKLFSSMASARRIQRLGLGQPVGGLQQQGQVVEADGDVGVVGPEALLVDGQRAADQRLGLGQPVGGLQQLRPGC